MYGYEQTTSGAGPGYQGGPYQQQTPQPGMGQGMGGPDLGAGMAPEMNLGGYGQQPQQPLYPEPSPPSLSDAVRAFTTGGLPVEDFQSIFITSKVYCPRGERPGFLALHNTPQPVIPMFSSLKELRRYAGKESKYFTVTGAEVLDLLPTGYGFAMDMEGEHRMVFDAKAVEQMVDFTMRRMYG
ncbi:SseB family protein [Streptacidiphilus sp. N1-3]|uniref:SseB family protein n=1 Tax=Streptacidiphilus alkalitolerans TaxID=3342712 RepID=A0ABV6X7B7_9ACTN